MAEFVSKIQEFVLKCARVWSVTRKPAKDEFKIIAQSAGIGLLLVGMIGYLISVLMRLFTINKVF